MDARNTIEFAQSFDEGESQQDRDKRAEGLKQVQELFVKQGDNYAYKDVPSVVAFSESENVISTDLDNNDVATAMTRLAQAKGWQFYTVSGSNNFYEAVEKQTERQIEEYEQTVKPEQTAIPEQTAKPEQTAIPEQPAKPEQSAIPEQSAKSKDTVDLANVVSGDSKVTDIDEKESRRRASLVESISNQYRVAGKNYYFKDQGGNVNTLAFKDTGNNLSTSLNTERVTKSLVELAEAKGWDDIKVSGHKDFKRQVWRAASERGIKVRGYTPDADDIAHIKPIEAKNTIEPVEKRETTKAPISDAKVVLLDHGEAPYKNEPNNSGSYYATVKDGSTERTVWGLGIQNAINESGAKKGDSVRIKNHGMSDDGPTSRNIWTVENAEKVEVITAVASAVAEKHIGNESDRQRVVQSVQNRLDANRGNQPDVPMYDNSAATPPSIETSKKNGKTPELTR